QRSAGLKLKKISFRTAAKMPPKRTIKKGAGLNTREANEENFVISVWLNKNISFRTAAKMPPKRTIKRDAGLKTREANEENFF
ncbi:MAG: hypothetical protein J5937_00565, partial [Paludibacteraceae bacterium]|nr:hypothetical protein [Paludibacteraceae bacterium]